MAFTVSLFYASLLALVLVALSVRVVALRRRHHVGIGSGDNRDLELAVRAHANFCEYVPVALVLILLLEATAIVSPVLLHVLGAALLIGRILHGFVGLNRSPGTTPGRFVGTLLTWLVLIGAALLALIKVVTHWWFAVA
jgi:uncharacterized protein